MALIVWKCLMKITWPECCTSSSSHDLGVALGGFGGPTTVFPCPARGCPRPGVLHRPRPGGPYSLHRRGTRPGVPTSSGLRSWGGTTATKRHEWMISSKCPQNTSWKGISSTFNVDNINPVIFTKTTIVWKWWRSHQVEQLRSWVGAESWM